MWHILRAELSEGRYAYPLLFIAIVLFPIVAGFRYWDAPESAYDSLVNGLKALVLIFLLGMPSILNAKYQCRNGYRFLMQLPYTATRLAAIRLCFWIFFWQGPFLLFLILIVVITPGNIQLPLLWKILGPNGVAICFIAIYLIAYDLISGYGEIVKRLLGNQFRWELLIVGAGVFFFFAGAGSKLYNQLQDGVGILAIYILAIVFSSLSLMTFAHRKSYLA